MVVILLYFLIHLLVLMLQFGFPYIYLVLCKVPNTHLDNHSDKKEVQFQAQDCVGDVEGRTAR